MGIDYYIASARDQQCYELGRGFWHDLSVSFGKNELRAALLDFAARFIQPGSTNLEVISLAKKVIEWCEERNWEVEIVSDADTEKFNKIKDWQITGDIGGEKPLTIAEVRECLEREASELMSKYCLDGVRLEALTEDVNISDSKPRLGWLIEAVSAYDQQGSRYRRAVVEKAYERFDDLENGDI